jgi:hypothetical protein
MATIDSNIALGIKPVQVENPMNQYAALSQIQNAQNQNALAQYQLSSAQRAEEGQNALSKAYQKSYNAETGKVDNTLLRQEIANSGHGYLLPKVEAGILTQQKDEATLNKTIADTDKTKYEQKMKQYDRAISHIGSLNTPQEAIASIDSSLAKGDIDQNKADMLKQSLAQAGPNFLGWKKNILMGSMDAKDQLHQDYQNTMAKIAGGNLAVNQGNLNLANQKFKFETNPETQAEMAGKKAAAAVYGKAGAEATIALPGAISTGQEAIRKIDAMIGSPEVKDANGKVIVPATKPHAGFEQAVGMGIPGLKYIPGSSVADFMARLEEVQGGAFLQAFNTLKGGGSITETEGTKATKAISRMSTAQSEGEFKTAAREFQDVIRTGIERAKIKASVGGANNMAAPSSPNIDALLEKYK